MTDSLHDHLREHDRDHYERVERAHVEATLAGIAASRQPLPDSLPDGERAYQDWLAERHGGHRQHRGKSAMGNASRDRLTSRGESKPIG